MSKPKAQTQVIFRLAATFAIYLLSILSRKTRLLGILR